MLRSLWYDETGLTTIEYALVLAIMALATATIGMLIASRVRAGAGGAAEQVPAAN